MRGKGRREWERARVPAALKCVEVCETEDIYDERGWKRKGLKKKKKEKGWCTSPALFFRSPSVSSNIGLSVGPTMAKT